MNWTTQKFLKIDGYSINLWVLEKLRKSGKKGITVKDFPVGYRLGAYIHQMRGVMSIATHDDPVHTACGRKVGVRAKYVLIDEFNDTKRAKGTKHIQLRYKGSNLQYKI